MAADAFVQCRVAVATKEALRAAAQRQQLTESALVKRMIEMMLQMAVAPGAVTVASDAYSARPTRLYVRLAPADWDLLRERAAARAMAPARYASILIRAHLRDLAPLPKHEYLALKQSVAELAALGRNFNQLARVGNQTGQVPAPAKSDLLAVLKVCEALHARTKALLSANVNSWRSGHAETAR
jgi:hypothetical protein